MVTYGKVLDSLADSTRREVLDLVRRKPSSVQEIADQLPISRPAVSQHLKILKDAGIVTSQPVGTRRVYAVTTDGSRRSPHLQITSQTIQEVAHDHDHRRPP